MLRHRGWYWGCFALAALSMTARAAWAQRAQENVVTAAEDAFGTKVGNDSIGLYNSRNARGFDPQLAGNMRIEGLYFDQQAIFGSRLTHSQTMRIGLSAQSYPFPAPTGIVDIQLVTPTEKTVVSVEAEYEGPSGQQGPTVDLTTTLVPGKLGLAAGIHGYRLASDAGSAGYSVTSGALFRWTPNDKIDVIPFIYNNDSFNSEVQPFILPGGAFLPPRYKRGVFFGQDWAVRHNNDLDAGLIVRSSAFDHWRLQAGLFRSVQDRHHNFVIFYRNVQPNGAGTLDVTGFPFQQSASTSGEARASGVFTQGSYRHTVHLAVRGRDTDRLFGGGDTVAFGPATIGVFKPVTEPTFTFHNRDRDVVRQVTPGVSYVGEWANVGEFSVGLQKSFYHREFGKLGVAPTTTSSQPWLYNGTVALYATPKLAIYAGYTRGIEEFGTAPDNAANAGEPLPAQLTKQIDAGLRYRLMPGVNLMVGVFEVSKPYFDRNAANVFTTVGDLRHRGVEMSLAGRIAPNLTVVGGALFLQARVSGAPVSAGAIGNVPAGTPPRLIRLNVQYDIPAVKGLSIDGQLEHTGGAYANRANTLKVASTNILSLGTRYNFTAFGYRATLRLQMTNLTNVYNWNVDGASGRLSPSTPRKYLVRLTADF